MTLLTHHHFSPGLGPIWKMWIGKQEPDTVSVSKRTSKSIFSMRKKVSFDQKMPSIWFSEPDTEQKIRSEPGSAQPASRYVLTLHLHCTAGSWWSCGPSSSSRARLSGRATCPTTSSRTSSAESRTTRSSQTPGMIDGFISRMYLIWNRIRARFHQIWPDLQLDSSPSDWLKRQRFTKRLVRGCENFLPA